MPPSIPQRYATAVAIMWQRARAIVMAALMLTLTSPTAYAQIAGSPQRHIASELAVERPAAPGGTVMLAIHMTPEPGWHGYWQNPGDAGFGMRLDWHLPKGARTASPLYPVPEALLVSGLMNHVFSHDYAVLVPLTLPADAPLGASLPVSVTADYLVCTQTICVPEQAHLATRITIAQGPQSPSPSFSAWRAKLPAPLGASAHLALASGQLRIAIPFPATTSLSHPHLFLIDDGLIQYAAPQHFARGPKSQPDTLIATLAANPGKSAPPALHAVLRLDDSGAGLLLDAQPGPVPADGAVLTDEAATHTPALGWLVLAALAGGLLLNVMPCVFPILSLKALSLARAGESAADARTEGRAYAAGTIVACAALGALLLARAARRWAGRFNCNTRPSWPRSSCWPQPSPPTLPGYMSWPCPASSTAAQGQPEAPLRRGSWPLLSAPPAPARSWRARWGRRCCCRCPWRWCCLWRWGWAWRCRS